MYVGKMLEKTTSVVAAVDPQLSVRNLQGTVTMNAVVPHGIASPANVTNDGLGAFRIELALPGAMQESLANGQLTLDIESERMPGALAEDTPVGWPRAHLRNLVMRRMLPQSVEGLRHQSGYNRWLSDPVIAIADPRASRTYTWPANANKTAEGCAFCDAPNVANAAELFSIGRAFRIRANTSVFGDTPYAYLAESGRLDTRINTIPADTLRAPAIRTAAQHPAIAGGLLQETTYLHSGELATGAIDFDFGGRAGWNVAIDRTYRSRSIGLSPLGTAWDAVMFKRLRILPDGTVEYRDGAEVWPFRIINGTYVAPVGLFVRLTKTLSGYSLTDQQFRITTFNEYGRLTSESDEFFDSLKPGSGNTIHYLYGGDGRLTTIVDPLGRSTTLTWDVTTGLLAEVRDWRTPQRVITYEYDAQRRLTKVHLPRVANASGQRPRIEFGYQDASGSFNDRLEIATNLTSIRDPKEAIGNGTARATFSYELDRITRQQWGSGESASFTYPTPTTANVIDVLGQERRYEFTVNDTNDLFTDRAHVTMVREVDVPISNIAPFGKLPDTLIAGIAETTNVDRIATYEFFGGRLLSAHVDGVSETAVRYETPEGAPGFVVKSVTTTPAGLENGVPITRTLHYQGGVTNGATFLRAIEAGGKLMESPEAHRNNQQPIANNESDHLVEQEKFDAHGRMTAATSSGGTDTEGAGAESNVEYWPDSAEPHKRGQPRIVHSGALETKFDYPSQSEVVSVDPRGTIETTLYDEWDRPKTVTVMKIGDPLILSTTTVYDATGRVQSVTRSRNGGDVTTRYEYDVMGRTTRVETDQIATVGTLATTTQYNLSTRSIITRQSSGAETRNELDRLGRVIRSVTETGSSPIEERFAYDIAGNRVYATDMLVASADAFDAHGRVIASRAPNGTTRTTTYDAWNRPTASKQLAADGTSIVAESSFAFTNTGRLESLQSKVDENSWRTTGFAWDGGGRMTRVATNGRAAQTKFDVAGRLLRHATGAGNLGELTEIFNTTTVQAHDGALPAQTSIAEKSGDPVGASQSHNVAGDVTEQNVGALSWKQAFDQLGAVTSASVPGRKPTQWNVDARGAVKEETLPDGAQNQYEYDASGAPNRYRDPEGEATSTITDLAGRPIRRTYADGTFEATTWDGARVKAVTDRQGRTQTYRYNNKGQLIEIRDDAGLSDVLAYDDAGRLASWRNADAEIEWSDFNLAGAPKRTTQRRFRDRGGLTAPIVLDEFEQTHAWNEHNERTDYSMPAYPGMTPGAGWTASVHQTHDAMGNITAISRGDALMSAQYRNAGRPDTRRLTTSGGGAITRTYGYDAATAQLTSLEVAANGPTIAGSEVTYDGLQLRSARLLGVSSGQRFMQWRYDDRSRLSLTLAGVAPDTDPFTPTPGRIAEELTPADYRLAQERLPQFDGPTTEALNTKGIDTSEVDPPSSHFERRPGGGHKIGEFAQGETVRPFGWNGAERVDDGRFIYEFDAKGRLVRATEKTVGPPTRRLVYSYSGPGRMVGRRAEYTSAATPLESDWRIEDRSSVLGADGLPAETSYVWDVITDNLIAVFRTAPAPTDAHGGLLRQVIHGGVAYDDPIETTTIDANGSVTHLYPIYDEAGAGSLQAVLDANGDVVARTLQNDAYGAEDVDFTGAAIDDVSVDITKDASGAIDRVDIRMHATERLDASTVSTGARLATVDASGAVVRTAPVLPSLSPDDPFTLQWTLTAPQWNDLVATEPTGTPARTPVALSIAATDILRAAAWSSAVPVMPAPEWATATQPVHTTPALPVEVRESLTALESFVTAIPPSQSETSTIYAIKNLALAGTAGEARSFIEETLSARFQALPFTEPVTGLVYVRNRWYDPSTGTFLSPDPLGYRDSANLYAFAGGDPVNGRDPLGTAKIKRMSAPSERISALDLVKAGWKVVRGETGIPHNTYGPGEDILAVKRGSSIVMAPTGEMLEVRGDGTVLFVDDKNLGRSKAYSSTALNENFQKSRRIDNAIEAVQNAENLTEEEKALALQKLRSGDVTKAVMAGAEESNVRGVGPRLRKRGIGFLPKTHLGKGLLVLSLVTIALSERPAEAAVNEFTLGGAPLNENDAESLNEMLVLTAVAEEMNQQRFIGPPTPPHLRRHGASGEW